MKKIAVEFKGVTVSYLEDRGTMGVFAAVLYSPFFFSWKFIRKILEWWDPKKKIVLKDVDFQFYAGEITGLIGPNGGGKSTAFKLITGDFPPDKGELLVFGKKAGSPSVLGGVYGGGPDSELFPEYSGMVNAQCTGLWLKIGTEDMRNKMVRLLNIIGISPNDMEVAADSLSSGTKMKISLARAFAIAESMGEDQCGQILLIDEPSAFLDVKSAMNLLESIRHLMSNRPNLAVIISTNNEKDLLFCDRLVCIQDRQLVEEKETLEKLKVGLKDYEETVLRPMTDLLKRSISEEKAKTAIGKPKKKSNRNYKGNPIMWRSQQEAKANIGLAVSLILSLFVPNWMYLGSAGPTLPNVILVTIGVLLSALNRGAYRIYDTERSYYMNARSLILSPYTRLQHAVMYAVTNLRYNVVYSGIVFCILCILYRGDLASQLTLVVDPNRILGVLAYLPGALCFVYGVGLFFSPLNMMMRSNNTFFLTYIIPILTITASGFYGSPKNLPWVLQAFGEFNPLTYLSQTLLNSSSHFEWSNLGLSSGIGITWLIAGFFAYSFGFKAAVIAKRVR